MFEDKEDKSKIIAKAPGEKSAVAVSDIVVHSFPKEFYNREVKLKEEPKPVAPVAKPVPPPPTEVVARPPLAKPPIAKFVPPKRRSKRGLLVVIFVLIVLLTAGGVYVGYLQGLVQIPGLDSPSPTPVTPSPTPVVPDPTPTVPVPEPSKPITGADTDSDGLSNVEELLYGTDFRNPDSDSDTFLDGNEVFHRFDPRGLAPSTLLDTGAVRVLEGVELPFSIYYPTTWNPVSTPASQRVSFRSATGAGVNIVWQAKAESLSLEDWYVAQVGEAPIAQLQPTATKEGYRALIGPDERVTYVAAGGQVYTVIYDLGDAKSIEFLQTFKMMINSFKLTP